MKSVDVIIPVYKPDKKFSRLLKMLMIQTYPIRKIIVMNTEKSYWNEDGFQGIPGLEVHHVTRDEFDHGGTRGLGAWYSEADIMLFMTDDAVPADEHLVEWLVQAFSKQGPGGEQVAMAYARQLPDKECSVVERYTRSFNYPETGIVKTLGDLERMGIKTYFASNVCCAYDREIFERQGGFINRTIFNEDMIYASGVIKAGYAVVYAAEAKVIHSHNYSCIQQFKRNFDMAVSQADHPEVFAGLKSEGEGIRLVKKTAVWLCKTNRIWFLPSLIITSAWKYAGYCMGHRYKKLPGKVVLSCSMNQNYWKKRMRKPEGGK